MTHAEGLRQAVLDGELHRLLYTSVPEPTPAAVKAYIDTALTEQARGTQLPFTVFDALGVMVGSTRVYQIDPITPTVSIGYTWYAQRVQRTSLNTACKRLLLARAFEEWQVAAVYFHTSHLNLRSQAAIKRLGAMKDGVIRHHMRHKDGSPRDTVSYSIIAAEWPAVRERLDGFLAGSNNIRD